MAKIVIQHEQDPSIAIVLEEVTVPTPGKALGAYGKCTECGWPMHWWNREEAIVRAQRHVNRHESSL
jgi:hypothetical protein